MGVAVSDWRLARAVSQAGHLGVVSGTALDTVMVRRLQLGDPGGQVRRALTAFPVIEVSDLILDRYFVAGGKPPDQRFKLVSMKRDKPSRNLEDLLVAANFVEVFLAKEGHDGPVGINYLEKLQAPTLPSLYGAMLAGVDYVMMGAGIPRTIPAVLDRLAEGLPVELKLDVKGATSDDRFRATFDPAAMMNSAVAPLTRPVFLAIVSSHILASMLAGKLDVPVDGFIVEAPSAGGHNAPPRGKLSLNEAGEPIYGDRDIPDFSAIRELGLPFWLAGGRADSDRIREALELGGGRGSGRNRVRLLRRIGIHGRREAPGGGAEPPIQGAGVHRPTGVAVGLPVQGGRGGRVAVGRRCVRRQDPGGVRVGVSPNRVSNRRRKHWLEVPVRTGRRLRAAGRRTRGHNRPKVCLWWTGGHRWTRSDPANRQPRADSDHVWRSGSRHREVRASRRRFVFSC